MGGAVFGVFPIFYGLTDPIALFSGPKLPGVKKFWVSSDPRKKVPEVQKRDCKKVQKTAKNDGFLFFTPYP